MKNISFSEAVGHALALPITSFLYQDMCTPDLKDAKEARHVESGAEQGNERQRAPGLSAQEIENLRNLARVEAVAETEKRMEKKYEEKLAAEAGRIRLALELFQDERKGYFSRVESEVVKLALAISAKILHREVQVDPLLVAALVRVAVDKLHDGSSVSVRVFPEKAAKWREYLANPLNGSVIAIIEDTNLAPDDCILETDLGSANFSIDAQLKEVEQGFFDLLAQRPPTK
jgi:flagellar assembly protein FliH